MLHFDKVGGVKGSPIDSGAGKIMNTLLETVKETSIDICHTFGLAWWVEIITRNPNCTYYFGPFLRFHEARATEEGYIEDLQQEGSQIISVCSRRCKPSQVTLLEDAQDKPEPQGTAALIRQLWNLLRRKQSFNNF
jgi:hypothetical protein